MGGSAEGRVPPPGERDRLKRALSSSAATGKSQSVPSTYAQWKLAQACSVPPWVLDGYAIDDPPVEWVARLWEFHQLEQSVKVGRE